MTKLKKLLLLIVVGVVSFSALNVNAEFFKHDNDTEISYNIAGFRLYVYGDEDLDIDNFKASDNNTLFIDPSEVTYRLDDAKVYELDGYKLVSAKLNILYIQEFFEEKVRLLKDHLNESSDGKYFCTLSVIYDVTGLPTDASNIYDSDYDNLFNYRQTPSDKVSSANLHQMIMSSIYDKESDTFDNNGSKSYKLPAHLFIPETPKEDRFNNYTIKALDRYIAFSDQFLFYSGNSYTAGSEKYRFMLHDLQENELELSLSKGIVCDDKDTCSNESADSNEDVVLPGDDIESSDDTTSSNNSDNNSQNSNTNESTNDSVDGTTDSSSSDDNKSDDTTTSDNSNNNSNESNNSNGSSSIIPDHTIGDNNTTNDNNDSSNTNNTNTTTNTDNTTTSNANTSNNQSNNNTSTTVANTTSQTTSTGQKVSVPNTATASNNGIVLFGMTFLTFGFGIIFWPEKKKQNI